MVLVKQLIMATLLCITGSWNSQSRRKSTETASHKYAKVMSSSTERHRRFGPDRHSKRMSHVKLESSSPRLENGDHHHVKDKKNKFVKGRSEAGEQPMLRLWYVTCCISHIPRKARAFYNEFCCDAVSDEGNNTTRRQGYNHEVMLVDPYFSIPVTPFTSHDYPTKY